MLGLLIILAAASTIKKVWPDAIIFILAYVVIAMTLRTLIEYGNASDLGFEYEITVETVAISFGGNLVFTCVVFFAAFGIAKLIRRRRAKQDGTSL